MSEAIIGSRGTLLASVTLTEGAEQLKERLGTSMPANIDNDLSIQSDDMPAMEALEFRGTTYYLVFNEAQLRSIGTGEYGMDQNYMQQADIQLSSDEWVPIGTWDNPFTPGAVQGSPGMPCPRRGRQSIPLPEGARLPGELRGACQGMHFVPPLQKGQPAPDHRGEDTL